MPNCQRHCRIRDFQVSGLVSKIEIICILFHKVFFFSSVDSKFYHHIGPQHVQKMCGHIPFSEYVPARSSEIITSIQIDWIGSGFLKLFNNRN